MKYLRDGDLKQAFVTYFKPEKNKIIDWKLQNGFARWQVYFPYDIKSLQSVPAAIFSYTQSRVSSYISETNSSFLITVFDDYRFARRWRKFVRARLLWENITYDWTNLSSAFLSTKLWGGSYRLLKVIFVYISFRSLTLFLWCLNFNDARIHAFVIIFAVWISHESYTNLIRMYRCTSVYF